MDSERRRLSRAPDHGHTVIGGMLAATLIAVFIIPVLFVLVERFSQKRGSLDLGHAGIPAPEPGQGDD